MSDVRHALVGPRRPRRALVSHPRRAAWLLVLVSSAAWGQSGIFVGQTSGGELLLTNVRSDAAPQLLIPAEPARAPAEVAWPADPVPIGRSVPTLPHGLLPMIHAAADEHGVPAALLAAVAAAESGFDPRAVSPKGAGGLMQLMPQTAQRFKVADRFSPEQSLRGGAAYLRWLSDRFAQRLELVLAAYNAGEGAVERARGVPTYAETQAYVPRVLRYLEHFRQTLPAPAGANPPDRPI